jgi:hypothetical protein
MQAMPKAGEESHEGLITIVEAQRRTKVYGPDLMRALFDAEIPYQRGPHGLELVRLADVEAWAARHQ